jgi:hypothetical protein
MANKPTTKNPSPKSGGAGNKAKATAKPSGTAKEKPIEKPPFTKDVSDLNLED